MTQCASFFAFKFQHCQALNCASSRGPLGPRHDVASFTVTDFSKKTHVVSRKIRGFQLVCNLLQLLETAKRAFSADQSKHGNKMKQSSAFGRNPCVSHKSTLRDHSSGKGREQNGLPGVRDFCPFFFAVCPGVRAPQPFSFPVRPEHVVPKTRVPVEEP